MKGFWTELMKKVMKLVILCLQDFLPLVKSTLVEKTLFFLVSAIGDSALAIADRNCNLNVIVNDADQTDKLGFRIDHQISALFRLRRGCERVIYWADPKPRSFIIEKEENFKDALGNWNISKFSLFKTYNSIPKFDKVEALNSGGVLVSGSYNISIQYLDEDLNLLSL
jgi:hypothetical protein